MSRWFGFVSFLWVFLAVLDTAEARRRGFFFLFLGGGTTGIIITVVILVICCIGYCCYYYHKADREEQEVAGGGGPVAVTGGHTTPCYLCLGQVYDDMWLNGNHRKSCAGLNHAFLSSLPEPYPVRCPKCMQMLKLWPDRGPMFTCDSGVVCPCGPSPIVNNGSNRLNCFVCDYDLCRSCAERQAHQQAPGAGPGPGPGPADGGAPSPWVEPSAAPPQPHPDGAGDAGKAESLPPPPSYETATNPEKV